jgi:uncharacterized protein (TIRG00374 family)
VVLPAIDLQALGSAMRIFDVRLVPPAVALYFVGVWLRSVRWRYLLPAPPSTHQLFRVSIIGFAVNNLVPVRIGDVARAYLLAHWCEVPYGTTVASLVVERILDGLTLALLLLGIVLFMPAPGYVVGLGAIATLVFGALAVVTVVAAIRPRVLTRIAALGARVAPPRAGRLLTRAAHTFGEGLGPLSTWRAWPSLIVLSFAAWAGQFGLFYVLMLTFPLPASPGLALLGGTVANFATLIPSSPGFVGTFDAALARVLVDTSNTTFSTATAYALIVHSVLFLPVILAGGVIMWRTRVWPHRLWFATSQPILTRP